MTGWSETPRRSGDDTVIFLLDDNSLCTTPKSLPFSGGRRWLIDMLTSCFHLNSIHHWSIGWWGTEKDKTSWLLSFLNYGDPWFELWRSVIWITGFLNIIWKSILSIYFKFDVGIWCVNVQNYIAFRRCWLNFGPQVPQKWPKMVQSGGFRPLSEKVFTQSYSNLWCTLVMWVFRNDSLLCHVGQISALLWP